MTLLKSSKLLSLIFVLACFATGCVTQTENPNTTTANAPLPSPMLSPVATTPSDAKAMQVTLPTLDAFFTSDEAFAKELANKLNLSNQEVEQLRAAAREETSKLRENESGDYSGSTDAARQLAFERIRKIIGDDKAAQLSTFVRDRWQEPESANAGSTEGTNNETVDSVPNAVPRDSRVVVNIPEYRMDVFEDGKLIKSYKVGIGYPEFPLPVGMRKAKTIIFNPTWTPPDEPWVEAGKSKVKVGQKIEAGSKLNPLGVLKIPIGLPSLIHGGKSPAKLGSFASHGCVGLTDPLAEDFAKEIARISATTLTDAEINNYKKDRNETKQVTLKEPVPVELRYETIVVEDGKLHIYRDVYDRDTNTAENLRAVLEANGVRLEDLSEQERAQVMDALREMSRDATGKLGDASASPSPSGKSSSAKVTRSVKGKKEVVIEVAALKGKGYPTMASVGAGNTKTKT